MIALSHLDGAEFMLNCDRIETIETTPDTVITLIGGRKIVVQQAQEEVLKRVAQFKGQCDSGRL